MQFCNQQESVIQHPIGYPALVLAGAGSGKTATIVERASRLMYYGTEPSSLCLLTFTNKACSEMKERLGARCAEFGVNIMNPPMVSTFHGFGYELIKEFRYKYFDGYPTIMDEKDVKAELGERLKAAIGKDNYKTSLLGMIDEIFNQGEAGYLQPDSLLQAIGDANDGAYDEFKEEILECILDYEAYKKSSNLVDYSDLINLPIHLLLRNPDIHQTIKNRYQEIIIDESQDTNAGQFILMSVISKDFQNIMMVGDDDQSIYEWRGAQPQILNAFHSGYQAREYRIENNYRSVPHIVNAATELVRNNENRFEKSPRSVRQGDIPKIPVMRSRDVIDMSDQIAEIIKSDIEAGVSPNDIAILYRTNKIGSFMQTNLYKHGVPYRVKAGADMMKKNESKMLSSMVRLAINPKDFSAFKGLTNYIKGVGPKKIEELLEVSMKTGRPILSLPFPKSAQVQIDQLRSTLESLYEKGPLELWSVFKEELKEGYLTKIIEKDVSDARRAGKFDSKDDDQIYAHFENQRMINIKLIYGAIKDRIATLKKDFPEEVTLERQWQEALTLVLAPPEDSNTLETNKSAKVTLSTVHAAKGLQWKKVFIAGFTQGLMPLADGMDFERMSFSNLEEERRLGYVALTRGADEVFLCNPERYDMISGGVKSHLTLDESQFEEEIKDHLVDIDEYMLNRSSYSGVFPEKVVDNQHETNETRLY